MAVARHSITAQCDAVASYMDGVQVKIAEGYKPPRKFCLPAVYNNKLPDVSKFTYDFTFEQSVLDKITEWKTVRSVVSEEKRIRLEAKRKKEAKQSPPPQPPPLPEPVKVVPTDIAILTPQPLSQQINKRQNKVITNGLDFADFDNDTSSPFDNMELKTINDMEELAQVLQPTSQWAPQTKLENILNDLTVDEHSSVQKEEENNLENQIDNIQEDNYHVEHRSISEIMQDLQRDLSRPSIEDWTPFPDMEIPGLVPKNNTKEVNPSSQNNSKLSNPLLDLVEEDKKLAEQLNDMGFPISRAARAIRDLGGEDNKKVVEYLLAVQSLEEIGISGDDAEKALSLTEYDINKAKMYYKNLCTLKDLGFSEDQVSTALLKCNIDRDRALDLLIT